MQQHQASSDRAHAVMQFLNVAMELCNAFYLAPDDMRMQVPYFVDKLQLRRLQASQVPGVVVVGLDPVLKALRELWAARPEDRRTVRFRVISVAQRLTAFSRGPQP